MNKLRRLLITAFGTLFLVCATLFAAACGGTNLYSVTTEYNAEQGTVTLSPAANADGKYEEGTSVTVTVTAKDGYEIDKFTVSTDSSAALSGGKYTFEVTADTKIGATFKETTVTPPVPDQFTVTVNNSTPNGGSITFDPALPADGKYDKGTTVTATVTANADYELDTLTVNGAAQTLSAQNTFTFTVNQDITVAVSFKAKQPPKPATYKVTLSFDQTQGNVTLSPEQPADGYEAGSSVTVTVTPQDGFEIDAFTVTGHDDAELSAEGKYTFAINADTTVTVTFKEIPQPTMYTLTLDGGENGTVTAEPESADNKYEENTQITVTVVPAENYEVDTFTVTGHDDAALSDEGKYTFAITADTTVTVTFKATEVPPAGDHIVLAEKYRGSYTLDTNSSYGYDGIFGSTLTVTETGVFIGDTELFQNDEAWYDGSRPISAFGHNFTLNTDGDKIYLCATNFAFEVYYVKEGGGTVVTYHFSVNVDPEDAANVTYSPDKQDGEGYAAGEVVTVTIQINAGYDYSATIISFGPVSGLEQMDETLSDTANGKFVYKVTFKDFDTTINISTHVVESDPTIPEDYHGTWTREAGNKDYQLVIAADSVVSTGFTDDSATTYAIDEFGGVTITIDGVTYEPDVRGNALRLHGTESDLVFLKDGAETLPVAEALYGTWTSESGSMVVFAESGLTINGAEAFVALDNSSDGYYSYAAVIGDVLYLIDGTPEYFTLTYGDAFEELSLEKDDAAVDASYVKDWKAFASNALTLGNPALNLKTNNGTSITFQGGRAIFNYTGKGNAKLGYTFALSTNPEVTFTILLVKPNILVVQSKSTGISTYALSNGLAFGDPDSLLTAPSTGDYAGTSWTADRNEVTFTGDNLTVKGFASSARLLTFDVTDDGAQGYFNVRNILYRLAIVGDTMTVTDYSKNATYTLAKKIVTHTVTVNGADETKGEYALTGAEAITEGAYAEGATLTFTLKAYRGFTVTATAEGVTLEGGEGGVYTFTLTADVTITLVFAEADIYPEAMRGTWKSVEGDLTLTIEARALTFSQGELTLDITNLDAFTFNNGEYTLSRNGDFLLTLTDTNGTHTFYNAAAVDFSNLYGEYTDGLGEHTLVLSADASTFDGTTLVFVGINESGDYLVLMDGAFYQITVSDAGDDGTVKGVLFADQAGETYYELTNVEFIEPFTVTFEYDAKYGTVKLLDGTLADGKCNVYPNKTVSFRVTVVNLIRAFEVKNGETVLTADGGVYEFTVTDDTTVTITFALSDLLTGTTYEGIGAGETLTLSGLKATLNGTELPAYDPATKTFGDYAFAVSTSGTMIYYVSLTKGDEVHYFLDAARAEVVLPETFAGFFSEVDGSTYAPVEKNPHTLEFAEDGTILFDGEEARFALYDQENDTYLFIAGNTLYEVMYLAIDEDTNLFLFMTDTADVYLMSAEKPAYGPAAWPQVDDPTANVMPQFVLDNPWYELGADNAINTELGSRNYTFEPNGSIYRVSGSTNSAQTVNATNPNSWNDGFTFGGGTTTRFEFHFTPDGLAAKVINGGAGNPLGSWWIAQNDLPNFTLPEDHALYGKTFSHESDTIAFTDGTLTDGALLYYDAEKITFFKGEWYLGTISDGKLLVKALGGEDVEYTTGGSVVDPDPDNPDPDNPDPALDIPEKFWGTYTGQYYGGSIGSIQISFTMVVSADKVTWDNTSGWAFGNEEYKDVLNGEPIEGVVVGTDRLTFDLKDGYGTYTLEFYCEPLRLVQTSPYYNGNFAVPFTKESGSTVDPEPDPEPEDDTEVAESYRGVWKTSDGMFTATITATTLAWEASMSTDFNLTFAGGTAANGYLFADTDGSTVTVKLNEDGTIEVRVSDPSYQSHFGFNPKTMSKESTQPEVTLSYKAPYIG